ncbi:MAG: ligase-associated DNA damage response endonuclease PdeM [Saprospiraceae bacterium]|nr:ligase-associated DNA damage response endonuclease PdeM [Saprospiraceae bacterium]MBL0027080.1 ligase-associated DNA damage response endonuclease PdeM [Saprospiraceae bacterium]
MDIHLTGHTLTLLPHKAILDKDNSCLIIADLHLGKIEHFRSSGIPMPEKASNVSLASLKTLLDSIRVKTVIFLGDLFHSQKNQSFESFRDMISEYDEIKFILVTGNHDILKASDYSDLNLEVFNEYEIGNLWFTHEPQEESRVGKYNLSGHIHPGVRLTGKAKQSITLPCFAFGPQAGLLPAFGYFTGKAIIKNDCKNDIFAISENRIYKVRGR